ncbi:hypothetical protein H0Z60_17310 [Ectothiorhodospiraceae bacterium WFHF3C12]|nr:hypothetical protein [Ectothiorhodospiraceae bacterium WFHF3C12]
MAFGSVILAVAGFSGGIVTLGTAGLVMLGLAIGFTGRLRARLLLGLVLWAAHAALAAASVLVGENGVTAILPAVYVVLAVAAGQGFALIPSVLLHRAGDPAQPSLIE